MTIHTLDNGWTVLESDSPDHRARLTRDNAGGLVRLCAQIDHIPSEKLVKCIHHQGSTTEERQKSLRVAKSQTPRRRRAEEWLKKRRQDGTYAYGTEIGAPIDANEAFNNIAAQLEDEIFSSIVTSAEVSS